MPAARIGIPTMILPAAWIRSSWLILESPAQVSRRDAAAVLPESTITMPRFESAKYLRCAHRCSRCLVFPKGSSADYAEVGLSDRHLTAEAS